MNRKFIIALFVCLVCAAQTNFAQMQPAKAETEKSNEIIEKYPNLKVQADEMVNAIVGNEYDKFADAMHPKIIKMVGGKAKFVTATKNQMAQYKKSGLEITDYTVENPTQLLKSGTELYVVLPTLSVIKAPKKSVNMAGALLGISEDNGSNWKFIRIDSKASVQRLFPNIANKLEIPAIGIK